MNSSYVNTSPSTARYLGPHCSRVFESTPPDNSVGQALSQVGTCTEELHLLTGLCSRYTAADAIVVTPNWAHYVVVLVLDRTCLDRNQRSVVLECLWQARAIEYSQVRLWCGRPMFSNVWRKRKSFLVTMSGHPDRYHLPRG